MCRTRIRRCIRCRRRWRRYRVTTRSCAIVDELHVVTRDVWEAVSLASGKRDRSLTLAISTPAGDTDSVMWSLVEHGRLDDDPAFYLREFAAPAGCEVDDQDAWAAANPALDDFLHRDALRATLRTSRELSFRRFRLGQWVDQVEGAGCPMAPGRLARWTGTRSRPAPTW